MSPTRQTLHDLIEIVDTNELDIIYHILVKFIPEDLATTDEITAIKIAEQQIANGETVSHDKINWD